VEALAFSGAARFNGPFRSTRLIAILSLIAASSPIRPAPLLQSSRPPALDATVSAKELAHPSSKSIKDLMDRLRRELEDYRLIKSSISMRKPIILASIVPDANSMVVEDVRRLQSERRLKIKNLLDVMAITMDYLDLKKNVKLMGFSIEEFGVQNPKRKLPEKTGVNEGTMPGLGARPLNAST
jgi:hypothetical protein